MALFQPGRSGNPSGRRRGSRNKITRDLKAVYMTVFEKMGGVQGLLDWARKNPDVFYSQISKMLPKDLEIKTEHELQINIISAIPEPKPLPAKYAREALPSGDES